MNAHRNFFAVGAAGLCAAFSFSMIAATPASATPHTVTATVGPVSVPGIPVSVCVDGDCVTTPPLTNLTLVATAQTDDGASEVVVTPVNCPDGQVGAAVQVSASVNVSATVSATVTGDGPNGPVSQSVGPKTHTFIANTPGVTVSSCTN